MVTQLLEEDGGVLWTLVILVILASVMGQFATAGGGSVNSFLMQIRICRGDSCGDRQRPDAADQQLARRVTGLALMYLGVFWLTGLSWPLGLAAIKLVVGWMAGAILGVSGINLLPPTRRRWPTEWIFLGLVFILVIVAVNQLAPMILVWFPGCKPTQAWGGLLLIGSGLVHLGIASRGLRTIISLLTILAGFEILYAVVETSTLVSRASGNRHPRRRPGRCLSAR